MHLAASLKIISTLKKRETRQKGNEFVQPAEMRRQPKPQPIRPRSAPKELAAARSPFPGLGPWACSRHFPVFRRDAVRREPREGDGERILRAQLTWAPRLAPWIQNRTRLRHSRQTLPPPPPRGPASRPPTGGFGCCARPLPGEEGRTFPISPSR